MDESKGKLKKIRKKAAAGTIFSKEHYETCVAHSIYPGSSVTHKKDPTRGMSKHDINLSVCSYTEEAQVRPLGSNLHLAFVCCKNNYVFDIFSRNYENLFCLFTWTVSRFQSTLRYNIVVSVHYK